MYSHLSHQGFIPTEAYVDSWWNIEVCLGKILQNSPILEADTLECFNW